MKKSLALRIGGLVMFASMIMLCAVSGTFAKYTASTTGSDTATVAKFAVKVEGTAMPTAFTFGLFETIVDTVDGKADAEVKENLIAPGTKGSFELNIVNESEVDVECTVALAETNTSNVAIKYSLDGTNYKSLADINTALAEARKTLDYVGGDTTSASITIYWQWAFEATGDGEPDAQDALDTAIGVLETAATVEVTATVTAEQID